MRPTQIDIRSENVFWGRQLFHDSLVFLFENDARRITASSCSCYYALFRGSPVTLREKRSTKLHEI